jgi:hypothetical protein
VQGNCNLRNVIPSAILPAEASFNRAVTIGGRVRDLRVLAFPLLAIHTVRIRFAAHDTSIKSANTNPSCSMISPARSSMGRENTGASYTKV